MPLSLRSALHALPVVTVLVITFALVTGGAARPYRLARVWGGPTEGERVSLRVEVVDELVERGAAHEAPVTDGAVTLRLHAPGFDAVRTAALDAEGGAEVAFEPPRGARPLELSVLGAGVELARGRLGLEREPWVRVARRRGGWAAAQAGEFEVRVAPVRGALAVPLAEPVLVEVTRAGLPAIGIALKASGVGARVTPANVVTDAKGRALLDVAPDEHAVSLGLELARATASDQVSFALPVVPGALRARREGDWLVIESPVPRDVAYFALVTQKERILGGRVVLAANGRGDTSARVPLPPLGADPTYAVVSSERDLRSGAAVGWPLSSALGAEPERTFDAVEALLLDGRPRAALRDTRRKARVRWVVAAFSAAALAVELLLLVAFTKRSDRALDAHLESAGMDQEAARRLAPKRSPAVLIALFAVALGFLVVGLVGVLRIE